MKDAALFIDYKYCTNCHVCEVTCRSEHDIPLDEWGIKVSEQGPVKMNGKWMWNYVPVPSDLCDLCADRRARGEKPTCEFHCLAQCIEVIPLDSVTDRLKKAGDTAVVFIP